MANLNAQTANQMSLRKTNFLKDLAMYGIDITVQTETQTGAFDHTSDSYVGGATVVTSKVYKKHGLAAPVKMTDDTTLVQPKMSSMGMGVASGNKLGLFDPMVNMVLRVRAELPLNTSATYVINGINYKFNRLVENATLGNRLTLWNVVMFRKG